MIDNFINRPVKRLSETLSKQGKCIVCGWTTVTAYRILGNHVYCCSKSPDCKEVFDHAIIQSIGSDHIYQS